MKEKSYMASNKRSFTTHKGIAVYPHLNEPDHAFNNHEGVYTCKLRVPADQAQELMDDCRQAAKDEFGKNAERVRMPWTMDEVTGELLFNTKSKYKPKFVDSQGQIIDPDNVPQIFGGSILKLAGTVYPYSGNGGGVSLQLAGVQIIALGERDTTNFAFEAEDGGYLADDVSIPTTSNTGEGEFTEAAHNF